MHPSFLLLALFACPVAAIVSTAAARPKPLDASEGFNVRDFGAVGDGSAKDTAAIQRAVAACAAAGGGTVVFPAGQYLSGSIHLESHLTLRLEPGAELRYSGDPADSPLVPIRWEGTNVWAHGPLLYANGKEDIAIEGRGTIDGQGENWWWRAGKGPGQADRNRPAREAWLKLLAEIEAGRRTTAADFAVAAGYLRPPLIELYGCRNVLVDGVTVTDSPFWMLHPVYSEHVVVRGVSFLSWGPNGDGIDVDSCRDVRISDCFFSTGDDCIVLKSGRDADGRRVNRPTEFVTISNCVMYQGHGGVAIGSETAGGVRDVVASNIVTSGTRYGIRIKSMRGRGGRVENVRCDNFVIENAPEVGIEVTTRYGPTSPEPLSERTPVFRHFAFSHITISNARQAVNLVGLPEKAISDLRFDDVTATARTGLVGRYLDGLVLDDVTVRPASGEPFAFDEVSGLVREPPQK